MGERKSTTLRESALRGWALLLAVCAGLSAAGAGLWGSAAPVPLPDVLRLPAGRG
jgi:hypothetical protein